MSTYATIPAPPDKSCTCGASHDGVDWERLLYVGVMCGRVEDIELRNCSCGSTLAVHICNVAGCSRRAVWCSDALEAYCGAHAVACIERDLEEEDEL